jgi:hypothetical protein
LKNNIDLALEGYNQYIVAENVRITKIMALLNDLILVDKNNIIEYYNKLKEITKVKNNQFLYLGNLHLQRELLQIKRNILNIDENDLEVINNSKKYKIGIVLNYYHKKYSQNNYEVSVTEEFIKRMSILGYTYNSNSIHQPRAKDYENTIQSVSNELIEAINRVMRKLEVPF